MNKNIINIACWSIGQHAIKNMLPAIDECKAVNLSGIYTRDKNRAEEQCKLYNCIQYNEEADLLSDPSVDAVYLSSPTGVHEYQILKCIEAGKSVLVEKTALPSLDLSVKLVEAAKNQGVFVMEAFMYRFHKQFEVLLNTLNSERYGAIIKIECDFGFPHLDSKNIRYNKDLLGGALYDAGAYTLSAARLLLGGLVDVKWSSLKTDNSYQVDTQGSAILENDKGVQAFCSWKFGGSYINQIRIWCEKCHILAERAFSKPKTYNSNILITNNSEIMEELETGFDDHFTNMLEHFANVANTLNSELEHNELLLQASVINDVIFKSFK